MQTFGFIAGLVQVLRVLQQQPSGPFENILVQLLRGLTIQLPTQVGQVLVEQLEDVEVVEDDDRLGQIRLDRADISRRHVHGHGLDPGTATTGFGIIKKIDNEFEILDFGCIETKAKLPLEDRLLQISNDLESLIKKYKPDVAGIEEIFFTNNIKTAISVSHARGVLLYILKKHKVPIKHFTPTEIKSSTKAANLSSISPLCLAISKAFLFWLSCRQILEIVLSVASKVDGLTITIFCSNASLKSEGSF